MWELECYFGRTVATAATDGLRVESVAAAGVTSGSIDVTSPGLSVGVLQFRPR